jgi:hypothetical protein
MNRLGVQSLVVAGVALLVGTTASPATVIDNFEEGPFSVTASGTSQGVFQTTLSPANAVLGRREIILDSPSAAAPMSMNLSVSEGADDELLVDLANPALPGQRVRMLYHRLNNPRLNLDLIARNEDRVILRLTQAPIGGIASVFLTSRAESTGTVATAGRELPLTGPGDYVFDITALSVMRSDIDGINIEFRDLAGDLAIADMSIVPEPASAAMMAGALGMAVACVTRRRRNR